MIMSNMMKLQSPMLYKDGKFVIGPLPKWYKSIDKELEGGFEKFTSMVFNDDNGGVEVWYNSEIEIFYAEMWDVGQMCWSAFFTKVDWPDFQVRFVVPIASNQLLFDIVYKLDSWIKNNER